MYAAVFYRGTTDHPFHTWAPFGARDDTTAEQTVRRCIIRNTAAKGTLTGTTRFTLLEVGADPTQVIDRTLTAEEITDHA